MGDNSHMEEKALQYTEGDGAVLGTLEGPCADIIAPTRNNHNYSEELWEKTFEDPIVTEMLENGGIPGELDHPTNGREETDSSRIAILMREKPEKRKDGKLWAKFDILNTPLGQIAHTLAKAGFKLGVSSRGNGEVYTDDNGVEQVEPNSYDFKAFDLVLLPAVKSARLNLITEGLKSDAFDYKKALTESLESAKPEDRQVMQEALDHLGIILDNYTPSKGDNLTIDENMSKRPVNNVEDRIVNELKNTLQKNKELSTQITELQEKLSACYAKEMSLETSILQQKSSIKKLTEKLQSASAIEAKRKKLEETLATNQQDLKSQQNKVEELTSKLNQSSMRRKELTEELHSAKRDLADANSANQTLQQTNEKYQQEIASLKRRYQESLQESKKDAEIKQSDYTKKLAESNKLVEKYKRIANNAVNTLIESKARMIGCDKNEIINRLPQNYSFNDIERICEDLRDYKSSMSCLPFNVGNIAKAKVDVNEAPNMLTNPDDDVTSLVNMVNNLS